MRAFANQNSVGFRAYMIAKNFLQIWAKGDAAEIVKSQLFERYQYFLDSQPETRAKILGRKDGWTHEKVMKLNNPEMFLKEVSRKLIRTFNEHRPARKFTLLCVWKKLERDNGDDNETVRAHNIGDLPLVLLKMVFVRSFNFWELNMTEVEYASLSVS